MRIPVFAAFAELPFIRKSKGYCEVEVAANRATLVDEADIRKGIRLRPVSSRIQSETRGSRESAGCLTAYDSTLNAQYLGEESDIAHLSQRYEHVLEKHILDGRKGMPHQCNVIAARVKTILSNPSHA